MRNSYTTLAKFRQDLQKLSDKELADYGRQLELAFIKTRSQELRIGRAMMLDEVIVETERRKPISAEVQAMSDEDLLKELEK